MKKKVSFTLKSDTVHVKGKIEDALYVICYYYIKTGVLNSDVNPLNFKLVDYDGWFIEIDTHYGDALMNPDRDIFGMIFHRMGWKNTINVDGKTTTIEKKFSTKEKAGIKACLKSFYEGEMDIWNGDIESSSMSVLLKNIKVENNKNDYDEMGRDVVGLNDISNILSKKL
mgnify:CR=1 FL=1